MALFIEIPKPSKLSEGFFKSNKVYPFIVEYQHRERGVDRFMKKIITRSKNKDSQFGIYSVQYANLKRKLGGDTSRFNFHLTGQFHNSFLQIPTNTELKIYADTKKDNVNLNEIYPNAFQFSKESLNIIIRGRSKYLHTNLLDYCRKEILFKSIRRE